MMKNIMFIHGSAGSRRNFKYLVQEFKGQHTLAFDLIGFGDEVKPKVTYNVDLYTQFLTKKMDLNQKYVLVGHSMGGILAKELALRFPQTIEKVFVINYPFDKEKITTQRLNRMFLKGAWVAKLMCHSKIFWKFLALPIGFIFFRKNLGSFWDYFKHSYHSETSALRNVILNDHPENLAKLKDKLVLISGEDDPFLSRKLIKKHHHYTIMEMGHLFFGFEREISKIIKKNLQLK